MTQETALIVGVGDGLSASLARLFRQQGMRLALAARNPDKLAGLVTETQAKTFRCDASQPDQVEQLFTDVANDSELGVPRLVVYNPSARSRGAIAELDPEAVKQALLVTCYGGFLVAQQAAKRLLAENQGGSILFTGASASVKGFARSASFAMGKFGLRGLAQSMARELAPKNIHVAHFVIDGAIGASGNDERLHPDAIAEAYLFAHRQPRSAWTWEFELRPWVEKF